MEAAVAQPGGSSQPDHVPAISTPKTKSALTVTKSAPVAASKTVSTPNANKTQSPRKIRKPKNDPCKVIIRGYPNYTQPQDLRIVFSKFGVLQINQVTDKFAVITYENENEAKKAVAASKKIDVYGEFVTIQHYTGDLINQAHKEASKPSTPKREFPRSKEKASIINPKDINLSGSFDDQVDKILWEVRLTQEEVERVCQLYGDVETALQQLWPGCVAMPFGSITTGLGTTSSDADCFVAVPPRLRSPRDNYVNKARRILQKYPQTFAEILAIPRANTPIVKFFHIPTETNCDLTFKTPLGAQNSRLIAFMLHADPRFIPLAVLIKYWAKVHDISGTGKLTNYALTVMIIFYLQQPPMSILPAVEWLQRDQNNDIIVDFWNTGFMDDRSKLPLSSNTSSISELLGGFFEFYSNFNFDELVICPFLGTPLKKLAFKDTNTLPDEFARYKHNVLNEFTNSLNHTKAICIQDPFEQCHNVATSISNRLAADIKAFFKFAANIYEKEKLNGCKQFLKPLLLEKPKLIRGKTNPEYRVILFPKIIMSIGEPDWKTVVKDVVLIIFEKMLKTKLGKVEENFNTDSKKEKQKYMGTMTRKIWKRKQFSRLYENIDKFSNNKLDLMDKEARITEEILRTDKTLIKIQYQLIVTYSHEQKSAVVSVKLVDGDIEAFRDFGKFFTSVLQNWFVLLLRSKYTTVQEDTAVKILDTIKAIDINCSDNDDSDEDLLNLNVGSKSSDDSQSSQVNNVNSLSDNNNS